MTQRLLQLSLSLFFITLQVQAQDLVLKPSISPSGDQVAFVYQGDIWLYDVADGNTNRLTIHEAYDDQPVWNDDGSRIAFHSDRYGNDDIFVINATGGTPKRLTYHSATDRVASFNNQEVLFVTRRIYAEVEREWEIYKASLNGGTPVRMMDALGMEPAVSPDGQQVAFVRGTCRTSREAYRGPANRDIWVYNMASGEYSQITRFDGNDFNPVWADNENLLYITSKSGKYNIHKTDLQGNDTQLTNETTFGVNTFSANDEKIVYQYGDEVALFDMADNQKEVLNIRIASDYRFDPVVTKTESNDIDDFAVSPNGKLTAYTLRGEVFVTRNDKEDSRSVRITNSSAREKDVEWLNDEILLFVSDRFGQYDLFMARSADNDVKDLFKTLKHSVVPLTQTEEEESNPLVSPNGKKIALQIGRGKLITADIDETGNLTNKNTLRDSWDSPGSVRWSPDSKWLAYSYSNLNFNEEVFIHDAENQQGPVNVSMHPKYDGNPFWSPDGSKLGFTSQRSNGDSDVWFVWLSKKDWEKSQEEWKREELTGEDDEEKEDDESENGDTSDEIVIDLDDIYKRAERVTAFSGNESDFVFDKKGEFIYYTTGNSWRSSHQDDRRVFKIKWDGTDKDEVLSKTAYSLRLADDAKYIYGLMSGGKLFRLETKNDKDESLSVKSELNINYPLEQEQIFDEAWRALNAGFYDPDFHGNDFNALRKKYKPLAMKASTKEDFNYIFNLMLGQLNASHMGLYRGDNPKETQTQRTGQIGIEGENVDGGFKVTKVLAKSPADKTESQLQVGDIIKSVDQNTIGKQTNFYRLMADKAEEPVLLLVNRDGSDKEIVIWPTRSLRSELYDSWVDERRRLTEEFSDGKLGYLHIQGMNWSSFERFQRELMAAGYGKEGIVIDVRYNGGGWTTDYLMAVLNVQQHAYTIPRGAAKNLDEEHTKFKNYYPFSERLPLASWTKPSIALCNQNSYSNAEIFSHAYKTLDIGTLVGKPTFGAVISTGGLGLIDGSYVRMPFRAWYVKATEENMEHGPAVPDIIVENPPAYKAKGVDPQLKKAVDELLNQL